MESKLEKVLSKEKVIDALNDLGFNFTYMNMYYYSSTVARSSILDDAIEQKIKEIMQQQINNAIKEFSKELARKLEYCEPDAYPCALCHDGNGTPNI